MCLSLSTSFFWGGGLGVGVGVGLGWEEGRKLLCQPFLEKEIGISFLPSFPSFFLSFLFFLCCCAATSSTATKQIACPSFHFIQSLTCSIHRKGGKKYQDSSSSACSLSRQDSNPNILSLSLFPFFNKRNRKQTVLE